MNPQQSGCSGTIARFEHPGIKEEGHLSSQEKYVFYLGP